jgi:hypothetical protein
MAQAMKEQERRDRLREYEAAIEAARSPVGVLVLFAKGREVRAGCEALEEAFAATPVDGVEDDHRLPAAVWVALRQGDVEATIDALVRVSRNEFVIAAHQELNAGFRLTTVEECRVLPDIELLEAQVAAFLRVPQDVVEMIAGWGPDDPRTISELDTLLEHRFGSVGSNGTGSRNVSPSRNVPDLTTGPASTVDADEDEGADEGADEDEVAESTADATADAHALTDAPADLDADVAGDFGADSAVWPDSAVAFGNTPMGGLVMSSAEFTALLHLTPEQRGVLRTLVRQTDITVLAGG